MAYFPAFYHQFVSICINLSVPGEPQEVVGLHHWRSPDLPSWGPATAWRPAAGAVRRTPRSGAAEAVLATREAWTMVTGEIKGPCPLVMATLLLKMTIDSEFSHLKW